MRELAAREAEYRMLAENSSDFLARHAPDGTYRYASPACVAITGYTPQELIGQSPFRLVATEDREAVRAYARAGERARGRRRPRPTGCAARTGSCAGWRPRRAPCATRRACASSSSVTRDISDAQAGRARALPRRAARHADRPAQPRALPRPPRAGAAAHRAALGLGRGAVLRPRPLQGRQRLARPRRGRPAAGRRRRAHRRARCAPPTPSRASAATSSRSSARTSPARSRPPRSPSASSTCSASRSVLDDGEVFLATSLGIAIARGADDRAEDLIRDADAAMYRAKERGKGRYEIFDEAMRADAVRAAGDRERAAPRARARRAAAALPARDRHRDAARSRGFEALVRWEHPTRGLLAPGDVHPARRGDRADRRRSANGCCARRARRRRAGRAGRRAAGAVGEPVGAPARPARPRVDGRAARWPRPGSTRRPSAWRSPRARSWSPARRRPRSCARSSRWA